MKISPKYTANDWNSLDFTDEQDWQKAVDILCDRIQERYFSPIDILISIDNEKSVIERSFGFAILALDCLLVETFQSFIDGVESSEGRSRQIFVKFLTTRSRFKTHFDETLAEKFYSEYRSGILHQGEIQGDGLLWSIGSLVMQLGNQISINRTAFHNALKDEFQDYIDQLRSPAETELRKNFKKKMDSICKR